MAEVGESRGSDFCHGVVVCKIGDTHNAIMFISFRLAGMLSLDQCIIVAKI